MYSIASRSAKCRMLFLGRHHRPPILTNVGAVGRTYAMANERPTSDTSTPFSPSGSSSVSYSFGVAAALAAAAATGSGALTWLAGSDKIEDRTPSAATPRFSQYTNSSGLPYTYDKKTRQIVYGDHSDADTRSFSEPDSIQPQLQSDSIQSQLQSNIVFSGKHQVALCEWAADQCNHNGDPRTASLDALFQHVKASGYDGVEFSLAKFASYLRNMPNEQVALEAKKKAEQYGLQIFGANIWWVYDYPSQDWEAELQNMRKECQYVKMMGGRYVTFQMWITPEYQGTGGAYRNDEDYLDRCAQRIEDLHRVCWDEGLNCYIETHVQRISEDPEAFVKIMDKSKVKFETNGDLSHYIYRNFRNDSPWMKRILERMGHTHQRMCRCYGDLSVNVPKPQDDWNSRGVTWTAFDWSRPGLEGGLSSRVICGESGPMHDVSDPLTLDAKLVPLYRMMAAFADASATGNDIRVDNPVDWDPWERAV